MISTTHLVIGMSSWCGLALLFGIAVGKYLGAKSPSKPCCGSGHPEAGEDDLLDVGLTVLEPVTAELLVSRPVPAPATRPLSVVRSTFEARA